MLECVKNSTAYPLNSVSLTLFLSIYKGEMGVIVDAGAEDMKQFGMALRWISSIVLPWILMSFLNCFLEEKSQCQLPSSV